MRKGDLLWVTKCRDVQHNQRHVPFWGIVISFETPYRFWVVGADTGENMFFMIDTGDLYYAVTDAPDPPTDAALAAQASYFLTDGRNI